MEYGKSSSFQRTVQGNKDRCQNTGPDSFNGQHDLYNKADHTDQSAHMFATNRILDQRPLDQAELVSGHGKNHCRKCNNTHTSSLDQQQDDRFAEYAPVGHGIVNDQPCYADSRCGCEQRL